MSETADTDPAPDRMSTELVGGPDGLREPTELERQALVSIAKTLEWQHAFTEMYQRDRQQDEQAFTTLDRIVRQQGLIADVLQTMILERAGGNGMNHVSALIVEDDPDLGEQMVRWLERRGAVVQLATTAQEAREVIGRLSCDTAPSHVIVDIRLGRESGVEIARLVRDRFPETRRILYTGYSDESVPRGIAHAVIDKPFREATMAHAILGTQEAA